MTDLRRVGDLLARFPEFKFDVVEHLLGGKYASSLEDRLAAFRSYVSGAVPAPDCEQRIVELLGQSLAREIAAYRDLGDITAFRDIPFCDKASLRARPESFIRQITDLADFRVTQTSGTTGRPVDILYSPSFYLEYLHLSIRKLACVAGVDVAADRFPTCFLYVDVRDARRDTEFITVDPTGHVGLTVRLLVDESDSATLGRVFRLADLLRPAVIGSRPHIFEMLVAYSATAPWTRFSPLCVVSSGSLLSERTRQETEDLFRAEVFTTYGLTECGLVGFECRRHDGLHVDETSVFVEVVDHAGRAVENGGEGELVLSTVANAAMPLLRYRSGDIGALDRSPCRCGHPGPRIVGIQGRRAEAFLFEPGVLVATARFNSLFWRFPVADFQVTQPSAGRLEIAVEPGPSCADKEGLAGAVAAHVRDMVPCPVDVDVRVTTFDRRRQVERYVTQRKGSSGGG